MKKNNLENKNNLKKYIELKTNLKELNNSFIFKGNN